jgi:uridine monophosphate synthetase
MFNEDLTLQLYKANCVRFGKFTLKTGIESPIYIDCSQIVAFPKLLKAIAEEIWGQTTKLNFDLLCGVPYKAFPIATSMSLLYNNPMILMRKEMKEHGTKKLIEGQFNKGQKVLVIEDIVTSGISLIEAIEKIREEGLIVEDAFCLINRQQGGKENLNQHGIKLHSVFTLVDILECLKRKEIISNEMESNIKDFLYANKVSYETENT